MSECSNPECYKKFSSTELRTLKYVYCPECNSVKYCSEKCLNMDKFRFFFICSLTLKIRDKHKLDCTKSRSSLMMNSPNNPKLRKLDEYDTVKNEDGEEVFIGKGTFGDIKLVKDSKTDTLFALKTVKNK